MAIQLQQDIENAHQLAIRQCFQAMNACHTDDQLSKKAIELKLIECLAQYGHYLYKNNDYAQAKKYYLKALKLDPDHLTVLNQIGMCLSKEQAYLEARTYFADIIERTEKTQERADAWLNIACTHRLQHNWQKAAKTLREAKRLAPNDPDIIHEEQKLRDLVSTTAFTSSNTRLLFSRQAEIESADSEETAGAVYDFDMV